MSVGRGASAPVIRAGLRWVSEHGGCPRVVSASAHVPRDVSVCCRATVWSLVASTILGSTTQWRCRVGRDRPARAQRTLSLRRTSCWWLSGHSEYRGVRVAVWGAVVPGPSSYPFGHCLLVFSLGAVTRSPSAHWAGAVPAPCWVPCPARRTSSPHGRQADSV